MLLDLACNPDLSGPIDQSKLPVTPDGFVVRAGTQARYCGVAVVTVCELQVVSMTVLYYWLYASLNDPQDARSCEHYLDWLDTYLEKPESFGVIQGTRLELYLYPLQGVPGEKPHPPEWLQENDGETV
jgi:hypothetical protein